MTSDAIIRDGARVRITPHGVTVRVSARGTSDWARGNWGTGRWPASTLAGRSVKVELDASGNLIDLSGAPLDTSAAELGALLAAVIGDPHASPAIAAVAVTGMITNGNIWGHPHEARAICEDGWVRTVRLGLDADTWFSWPARGRATAGGGVVRGFVVEADQFYDVEGGLRFERYTGE